MNSKQRKTLAALFREPKPPIIAWADIESLLRGLGCRVIEGSGSAVKFELHGVMLSVHRPHPAKDAKRYQVRDTREFLTKAGVVP